MQTASYIFTSQYIKELSQCLFSAHIDLAAFLFPVISLPGKLCCAQISGRSFPFKIFQKGTDPYQASDGVGKQLRLFL
jgi:hypothetical protein